MDKTEIIILGIPLLTTKVPADFTCDITGTLIAPSSIVRNLGVMFDPSLSFQSHINSLSNAEFTLHDFQTHRIAVVFTLHDYLG